MMAVAQRTVSSELKSGRYLRDECLARSRLQNDRPTQKPRCPRNRAGYSGLRIRSSVSLFAAIVDGREPRQDVLKRPR